MIAEGQRGRRAVGSGFWGGAPLLARARRGLGVVLAFLPLGCAGASQATPSDAAPSSSASAAAPEPAPAPEPSAEPEEKPAPEPAPAPPEAVEPARPDVAGACRTLCERTAKACSERAAQFCTASCGDYVNAAEQCPVEVTRALSCQAEAEDVGLCANIARPECAPMFVAMRDCRSGKKPPLALGELEKPVVASTSTNWSSVEVAELGLTVRFPSVYTKKHAPNVGITASHGGSEYVVESFEGFPKLTDSTLLRAVTAYLGNACQAKLRLHGRYETKGIVHVRFTTTCSDGLSIEGMVHVNGTKWVAASKRTPPSSATPASAPPPGEPSLDDYLYSLEFKEPAAP